MPYPCRTRLSFPQLLPLLVLLTVWINLFFILNKGNAKALKDMGPATAAWIAAAAAAGAAALTAALVTPLLRRRVLRHEAARIRCDGGAIHARAIHTRAVMSCRTDTVPR
jgi:hypothetical protein